MREHNVAALTAAELEAARRELVASPGPGAARLPGPHADPGPHDRHRRRTRRTGCCPARVTCLPVRPAAERQARGLRKDAPAPSVSGVLAPGTASARPNQLPGLAG
jgi:hypothetical protein